MDERRDAAGDSAPVRTENVKTLDREVCIEECNAHLLWSASVTAIYLAFLLSNLWMPTGFSNLIFLACSVGGSISTISWISSVRRIRSGETIRRKVPVSWSNPLKHGLFSFLAFIVFVSSFAGLLAGYSLATKAFASVLLLCAASGVFSQAWLARYEYGIWKAQTQESPTLLDCQDSSSTVPQNQWWTQDETRQEIRRR